jgi:predicted esterase
MEKSIHSLSVRKILWGIMALVFVGISILTVQWATYARPPLPEAIDALESDGLVTVTQEPWLTFTPVDSELKTGFIFYPGGRIDPQGYASLMKDIASESYLVVIPEMPINMAVFNPNVADEIINYYPIIKHWIIAGHSVGGVMAAQYTNENREDIDGLMIWASYPARNSDLSDIDIPVVSIYGSLDPRVNDLSISEQKDLLPVDAHYIRVEGGGHHQFGAYEIKPEEHQAVIPRAAQHEQILHATLVLLTEVEK